MKLSIIILLLLASCAPGKVLVTTTQPHVVTRVDTIGKHVYVQLKPVGPPRSSLRNGHKPGDTIPVLHNYFIRY